MKFKVAAAAKNVRLPEGYELTESGNGERGDVVMVRLADVENSYTKAIRGPEDQAYKPEKGEVYLTCLTRRYAPIVLNAEIPENPKKGDLLDVVSRAGAIAVVTSSIPKYVKMKAEFLGFVTHKGKKMNVMDFSLPVIEIGKVPKILFSIGVLEGCGKTKTNEYLTGALVRKGYKVCVGKVTGQGNPRDVKLSEYRGAKKVHGILDAGTPSTVGYSLGELEEVFMKVMSNLAKEEPDFLIIEIADGVTQRETAMILDSKLLKKYGGKYMLSCNDPPGAHGGMMILKDRYGVKPILISGKGARSEMLRKEIEELTGLRAYDPLTQSEEMAEHVIGSFGKGK